MDSIRFKPTKKLSLAQKLRHAYLLKFQCKKGVHQDRNTDGTKSSYCGVCAKEV